MVSVRPVHAQEVSFNFTIHAFSSVKVIVSYAYTENYTHTDVSSTNQSLWQFSITPNGMSFSSDAVDVFKFSFTVQYPVSITQNVVMDVFQGSQQVEDTSILPFSGDTLSMTFQVVTAMEPHYPTADEILNLFAGRYPSLQNFNDWINYQKAQMDTVNSNQLWQWAVVLILGGMLVFTVYGVFWKSPKKEAGS
jgi:hypothetical protein